MAQKFPRVLILLLGALFVLNIVQAIFTELLFDEAYYWYYSQTLSAGYFDHPPMVAFMARLGRFFFDGELGLRLISCFMGVGTYILLWSLIDNPKKKAYATHFFLLLFSMALVNVYGFFTLPDTPLLFFTALFLLLYKKYIANKSVLLACALGLTMAALMYSKYHAVLIILFVLVSNWRLVFDKYAWLAVAIALLCYIPHFKWLLENDFVSIKYHLFERPNHAYSFSEFTLGYFLNLILVFGLLFPWAYKALFKSKSNDDLFLRALQFLSYGFILFFFVSSFNRRVQTQWIVIICVPIAVLTFKYLITNRNAAKWILRMGIVSAILVLYGRAWLINDHLLPMYFETHENSYWVKKMNDEVADIPVVFRNSYRRASMYAFYSGNPTFSLNTTDKRRNQYSIDDSESIIQGKKVAYVAKDLENADFEFSKSNGTEYRIKYIDSFRSFRKLRCFVKDEPLNNKLLNDLEIKIYNPYSTNIAMEGLEFYAAFLNEYKEPQQLIKIQCNGLQVAEGFLRANDTAYMRCSIPSPKDKNVQYIRLGISENGLNAGINSNTLKFSF